MRLFVGIDLPEGLSDAVADAQDRFAAAEGLRAVDPGNAHLTLCFLGEVDPDRVDGIEAAVARAVDDAGVGPFEMRVGGFGVFPALDYVRVVWAGVREGAGVEETTRLNAAIERELAGVGIEGDDRAFTPHITLARMDDARGKEVVQRVVRETDPDLGAFRVEAVRLKESTLTGDGPAYETVRAVEL